MEEGAGKGLGSMSPQQEKTVVFCNITTFLPPIMHLYYLENGVEGYLLCQVSSQILGRLCQPLRSKDFELLSHEESSEVTQALPPALLLLCLVHLVLSPVARQGSCPYRRSFRA